MRLNSVLPQCILCYFQYFFIISIGIGIYFVYYKYLSHNEKIFLNMIMSTKQQFSECNSIEVIKWEKSNNETLKIKLITVLMI